MESAFVDTKQSWHKRILQRLKGTNIFLSLCVICFACSSWVDFYGVLVEMPILVHIQPEGWSLPSYVCILIQCAMLGPLTYMVVNKLCPGNVKRREVILSYMVIAVGVLCCVLLAIFWPYTMQVGGQLHSLPFLVLVGCLALVDTTSCVIYLPFMHRFSELYIPYFMAGECFGGFLCGILGLLQGAGSYECISVINVDFNDSLTKNITIIQDEVKQNPPRFSVSVFFILLSIMLLFSCASFTVLNFTSLAKKHKINRKQKCPRLDESNQVENGKLVLQEDELANIPEDINTTESMSAIKIRVTNYVKEDKQRLWTVLVLDLVTMTCYYSIQPSLSSFACLPYGHSAYNLATWLTSIAGPVAALTALILPSKSMKVLLVNVILVVSLTSFHFYLAWMSPFPPLKEHVAGKVLVVLSHVVLTSSYNYLTTLTACILRTEGGHRYLVYRGWLGNVGTTFGGVTAFLLVTVFKIFTAVPPCM